jgi:hypothetical protein
MTGLPTIYWQRASRAYDSQEIEVGELADLFLRGRARNELTQSKPASWPMPIIVVSRIAASAKAKSLSRLVTNHCCAPPKSAQSPSDIPVLKHSHAGG